MTPRVSMKCMQSLFLVAFVVSVATYLAACSTVVNNRAEEGPTAEWAAAERAAAERAAKQAAAKQAAAKQAAAEQAAAEQAAAEQAAAEQAAAEQAAAEQAAAEQAVAEQAVAEQAVAERTPTERTPAAAAKRAPAVAAERASAAEGPPSNEPISNLESYSVTVSANEHLAIPGPPGELRVWIGSTSRAPRIQPGMSTETEGLETIGQTAKVKPFALGIDVSPKESVCEKIDSTGSEVRFTLTPSKTGVFTVGADVELYSSNNCTGIPVPKSAKSVKVSVTVDKNRVILESIRELIARAWKAFLDFWDKVLLLIFGLIIFFLRKKLFKLFGYKSKE